MAVTLQATIRGTVLGQGFAICRHFHSPSAGSMPSVSDFGEQFGGFLINSGILDYLGHNTFFDTIALRSVVAGSVSTSYQPVDFPVAGGVTTDALPPYVAFKVRLTTVDYAKPSFGWLRLAGVPEVNQTNGTVLPTIHNGLQAALEAFLLVGPTTAGGAGTWLPCVYSREYENHAVITAVTLDTYLTTQNSRKVGRGI